MTTNLTFPKEKFLLTCLINHSTINKSPSKLTMKVVKNAARRFADMTVDSEKINDLLLSDLEKWKVKHPREVAYMAPLLSARLKECACKNKTKRPHLDILEGAIAN